MISAERVREVLNYDKDSGVFTWRVSLNPRGKKGAVAGCVDGQGYRIIGIDGRSYFAHRLAWLHVTGEWPTDEIDHINGVRCDNSLCNLREATATMNRQNMRKAKPWSTTGVLGVFPAGKRYMAKIRVGGKENYLGTFDTVDAASAAYVEAKRRLHQGCTI